MWGVFSHAPSTLDTDQYRSRPHTYCFVPPLAVPLPSLEVIAVFMSPYFLRAVQLVIAYNTYYRLKYARYVKGRNLVKISAVIGGAISVAAILVLYNMPERYARCERSNRAWL